MTFILDDHGQRVAAIVPFEVADQALRLRAEAESTEVATGPGAPIVVVTQVRAAARRWLPRPLNRAGF